MLYLDRYRGSLVGLAIGDALGAPVEGLPRGQIVTDYQLGGLWGLPLGGWTDDTAQALCIADGLLEGENFPQIMDRFVRWMEMGYNSCSGKAIGIGGTTLKALQTYRETGQIYPSDDTHSAGNGCIMRLAPVVLNYFKSNDVIEKCRLSCVLTHGNIVAQECTKAFGGMLHRALAGMTKDEILNPVAISDIPELECIKKQLYKTKTSDGTIEHKFGNTYFSDAELKSDGYCVNTLECALWAFYHTDMFEDGMTKAIALGGDTDTIGAVYGQLAGAYYGIDDIPNHWKDKLMWYHHIDDLAIQLYDGIWIL